MKKTCLKKSAKNDKPQQSYDEEEEDTPKPADDSQDFSIDPVAVKDEYIKLPSTLARANEKYAIALGRQIRAKHVKEEAYATAYADYMDNLGADKKPSEASIKQALMLDKDYRKACRALETAEYEKAHALGVCEAIRAKKDMLVSLGAHVRAEYAGHGSLDAEPKEDEDDEEDED